VEDLAVHFSGWWWLAGGGPAALRAVDGVGSRTERGDASVSSANRLRQVDARTFDPCLQMPTRGRIVLDGQVVTGRHRAIERPWPHRQMVVSGSLRLAQSAPDRSFAREDPLRLHGVTAKERDRGTRCDYAQACGAAARTGWPLPA